MDGEEKESPEVQNRLFYEIIILAVICGILSGTIYYYRTQYMELSSMGNVIFRAVRMTIVYFIIPMFWLVKVRKFKLEDLGLTSRNMLMSLILGIGVYAIALAVFLMALGIPEFDKYYHWGHSMPLSEFMAKMALIAWMATLTDIWTRGMVLMPVLKLRGIFLAVLLQNLVWFAAHMYEIDLLADSITLAGAVMLTLTLGILGDLVAIKTKNIIGLCVGHIALNICFFSYIRFLM
ncbi:MAG: hypothetical protein JSV49_06820 [Thermoplasmata archaeon]|nr:MAG: hypothetical protein JSV49_06820 [Thermoplasmata archaeon]